MGPILTALEPTRGPLYEPILAREGLSTTYSQSCCDAAEAIGRKQLFLYAVGNINERVIGLYRIIINVHT